MSIYLGLGSNFGNTKDNILKAISLLNQNNINIIQCSALQFNPAMLLQNATDDYNIPFCNAVIEIQTILQPHQLLEKIQQIEISMGRNKNHDKWSPRVIDIDILSYNNIEINTETLQIPHYAIFNRACILDLLGNMNSSLNINNKNILLHSRKHKSHLPSLMGILNITNDSFSEDGKLGKLNDIENIITEWINNAIPIIDIGAESTGPNATKISQEEEITRLKPIFNIIKSKQYANNFTTKFSIDSINYETIKLAIDNGFTIINDQSNISDIKILDLVKNNKNIQYIAMHSLVIPVNKNITLHNECDIILEMQKWSNKTINKLLTNGLESNQIILDFGIGFGKTKNQSLKILQNFEQFNYLPCKTLVGHSKKSFMNIFTTQDFKNRLIETIALSIELKNKGIDILRIHNPIEHQKAFLSALHCINQFI